MVFKSKCTQCNTTGIDSTGKDGLNQPNAMKYYVMVFLFAFMAFLSLVISLFNNKLLIGLILFSLFSGLSMSMIDKLGEYHRKK